MKHVPNQWKLILPLLPLFIMVTALFGPMVGNFVGVDAAGTVHNSRIRIYSTITILCSQKAIWAV